MDIVLHPDAPLWTQEALRLVRDASQFQWYAVTLLGLVMYVYSVEIEKRNWNVVLAGLAFWGVDWINEIVNGVWLHVTKYSALWTTSGSTSYQIFVGLNLEIMFLFAISGVLFTKSLPPDRKMKILGIPNRWFLSFGFSCFAVFVEVLLNRTGYFGWTYSWWNWPNIVLIILFGYGTFFVAAFVVHDMRTRAAQLKTVGAIWGIVLTGVLVFGVILRWI
ncbi:MAG: hypothetical protein WDA27_08000 [Actinomycetota bacterium]